MPYLILFVPLKWMGTKVSLRQRLLLSKRFCQNFERSFSVRWLECLVDVILMPEKNLCAVRKFV